ncbi:helix-turn-helix domain-containing protein [Oceaniglobus trochenteri]|uniref:helix-turn-helix domain-containing protein n=1 Tax=Oceaniglobus trochenteri TaxID=2763260 RepID=UPI001CFFA252|nr:helix-turn-helix domain-containing protein [Oceaniglobus trochenteri]
MTEYDDPFVAGLLRLLKERKLKPAPLSKAAGLSESFIRDLQSNPASSPKTINAQKIADLLGLSISDIIEYRGSPSRTSHPIAVVGRVGAGARVPLNDSYPKGDGLYHVACPPQLSPKGLACVEVCGNSMEPAYLDGDLLFYSRPAMGVPSEAIGTRCVVEDADGMAWVKLVRRREGQPEGLFDLVSFHADHPPMYDCTINWAAPILMHQQAAFAIRIDLSAHEALQRKKGKPCS